MQYEVKGDNDLGNAGKKVIITFADEEEMRFALRRMDAAIDVLTLPTAYRETLEAMSALSSSKGNVTARDLLGYFEQQEGHAMRSLPAYSNRLIKMYALGILGRVRPKAPRSKCGREFEYFIKD